MLRDDEHEQVHRRDDERAGERELVHVGPRHAPGGEAAQHVGGEVQRPGDHRQRDADAQCRRAAVGDGCRASRRAEAGFAGVGVDVPVPPQLAAAPAAAPTATGAAAAAAAFASSAARRDGRATREVDRVGDERDGVHGHRRVHGDDGDLVERHGSTLRRRIRAVIGGFAGGGLRRGAAAAASVAEPACASANAATASSRPGSSPRARPAYSSTTAPSGRRRPPSPTCGGAARRARRAARRG